MMKEIIPQFHPDATEKLKEAAASWRMPFWDWAAKKDRNGVLMNDVPLITKDPVIKVMGAAGQPAEIPNPMYKYNLPKGTVMGAWGVGDTQDQGSDGGFITVAVSTSLFH